MDRDKQILAAYKAGDPIKDIVGRYHTSTYYIYKLVDAAGIPRRNPKKAAKHKEEIKKLYCEECFTLRELAEKFECNPSSIWHMLRAEGVELRKGAARYLTSRDLELEICKDYLDCRSAQDVGKKYELSAVTVLRIAKAYGIITSPDWKSRWRRII